LDTHREPSRATDRCRRGLGACTRDRQAATRPPGGEATVGLAIGQRFFVEG